MAVNIFLSTVSDEFLVYREQLRTALTRPNVEVKVQEDFKDLGGDTLAKLDAYIALCDAVVHLSGDMTGSGPGERETRAFVGEYPDLTEKLPPLGEALKQGVAVSYTQWEAWLALYHGKTLQIAKAGDAAERGPKYAPTEAGRNAQGEHLKRLRAMRRYPGCVFTSPDNLAKHILGGAIVDLLARAQNEAPPRKPRNLPYGSLGSLFKGRDAFLDRLHEALSARDGANAAAVIGKALHGLGGVGKTRLAVEYALRHEAEHSALLFFGAETPAKLEANLAALAGPDVLDLKENDAREDAVKIAAVLRWLEAHPGWLMILDNTDTPEAVAAVEKLLARLRGGRAVITGRMSNFSAAVRKLELGVLDADAATQFLLERTQGDRTAAPDDAASARALAGELGGLALGLEQAGAHIAAERVGFARYLMLWREKRASVLAWFDKTLTSYNHDTGLAATWATSVERLTPQGRALLERLAFLAPEPIPDALLDVAAPGEAADFDAHAARANLFAYSLAARANAEDGKPAAGFAVHRLVQDYTRRGMDEARRGEALREALGWVDAAFAGNPGDIRDWPALDPLAPHALALAEQGDQAGITAPTARLFEGVGRLLRAKARNVEAEPLYRRALAIDEGSHGPDHPTVAIRLNNLAGLLRATNRLVEAELLCRRALAIDEASRGPDHPTVAVRLNNLAGLLRATNRPGDAEPLFRRALAIFEASYGREHAKVATSLNNLATLLQDANRAGEAEPLFQRALAIDEANYGPDHPEVATDLNNLAGLLYDAGRPDDAEPLFRRALAINETSYGPDHPTVATGLSNLALLLRSTNRPAQAEPLLRSALAIDEARYGRDHPDVAIDLNNLARLLLDTNRPGEAEPLFRRALAIDEASYGPHHPNVARVLNNLAGLLRARGDAAKAQPLYERALAICEASLGPNHPTTLKIRANLAALVALS